MDGKNITAIRKRKGITQEALAHLLSVTTVTLSRWENSHFEPKVSMIKKLCEILNCTETELLKEQDSQTWELRMVVNKTEKIEGGTKDMTGNGSTATLNIGDTAMAITLSAGYPLWEDDEEFEGLIEDLRRKRQLGLKTRKEGW